MLQTLTAVDQIKLPPDSAGTARAFGQIGYELAEALADLIDNSIDASAKRVEITFICSSEEVTAITIADDGRGMSPDGLRQAMRFAGTSRTSGSELGTFGMGLKSASFSQCRTLTVVSRQGQASACRWSFEQIGQDWTCELLDPNDAALTLEEFGIRGQQASRSGTLVIWQRLHRLGVGASDRALEEFTGAMMADLIQHLGIVFHRFIERDALSITLKARHEHRSMALPRRVKAINPFAYPRSGKNGYPRTFRTDMPGIGELELEAHIWPANSVELEFLLDGKKARPFQGLYFYRNDRLIQAGGWDGVITGKDEADLTPARVLVDLPAGFGELNVQKTRIQVTAAQSQALARATCGRQKFSEYLEDARAVSRAARRKAKIAQGAAAVPGAGLPVSLKRHVEDQLPAKAVAREINFAWKPLAAGQVFELDTDEDCIILNADYRKKILTGASASGADAVMVKTLLFLLLKDDFERARFSPQRREWMDRTNALLYAAVKRL